MLKRVAGTDSWHEGGFRDALKEAERTGRIAALGAGFYRDADRRDPVGADPDRDDIDRREP